MRVLTVSPNLGVGGLERIAVDLANALAGRGVELTFAAPDGPLGSELDERVGRVALRAQGRAPAASAETALRLARTVRRLRPDIVHAHNVKASGIAGVAMRLAAVRQPALVGTFHGVAPGEDRAAVMVLRLATAVACVSDGLAERLRAAGGRHTRIEIIPNAVSPVAPLDRAARARLNADLRLDEGPVVAYVGRLMPVKAPQRFLETARIVAADVPGARFLVVGDGPLRAELEARAAALGLGGSIRFTGWRTDARRLIARADVLVVSSDSEGLSVAALEALSAGVPVVSTPVTGMAELLAGGAGIVAARPRARELAEGVIALLSDPADRERRGLLGRAVVERRHGPEAMVDRYAQLFEQLRRG